MLAYISRRLLYLVPVVLIISAVAFVIMELPPGSWVENYIFQLQMVGDTVAEAEIAALKARYGVDRPLFVRYWKWISGWPCGDFGMSFQHNMPVMELIGERILLTATIALATMVFVYAVSIPIAVYSSTHQYSVGDYATTVLGFLGLAIPNFMLALVLMYFFLKWFHVSPGGLFSPEFQSAPWSLARLQDLLSHLWLPIVVVGTAGTAGTIRVLRATMLDELGKDYVQVARSKGLPESEVVFKHALRVAINPLISRIIWELPQIISGATITAVVLSLPILGQTLLISLQSQDMYVAGTIIFFQSILVVIGGLISDILLAVADPRIRYD